MANYKLVVEYDGTNYHGFQIQPKDITIQGCLEAAISRLAQKKIRIIGAARTDAGVHAYNQVINFHGELSVPIQRLPAAINSLMPRDIRVKQAYQVHEKFHARYDAVAKTYLYRIRQGKVASVFDRNYCWWIKSQLNWQQITVAGKILEGTYDFKAFAASGSSVKTTIRHIEVINFQFIDQITEMRFTANGFLYNMVRNMVGTLVDIGRGKMKPDAVKAIIASKDRSQAGVTAPAQGLFLEKVFYKFPNGKSPSDQ